MRGREVLRGTTCLGLGFRGSRLSWSPGLYGCPTHSLVSTPPEYDSLSYRVLTFWVQPGVHLEGCRYAGILPYRQHAKPKAPTTGLEVGVEAGS